MEGIAHKQIKSKTPLQSACIGNGPEKLFSRQWEMISKQERIKLQSRANYYQTQHSRAKSKITELEQIIIQKNARIKDLEQRLYGKKSEKSKTSKKDKNNPPDPQNRKRGQQPGSSGHGRTQRPNLPIIFDEIDLPEDQKSCPTCGLPHHRNPSLDEQSDFIEVEVRSHTRRYRRFSYTPNKGCHCDDTAKIITAAVPPRIIPHSHYGVSFWVEILLSKYLYGQPTHRYLQDLADQGLPVSPGTVTGGLKKLAPLFEPIVEAFYCKQMSETLFHNDETRWEVFVTIEGKVGHRWYLWVTRSKSVIFYSIDPTRSTAVPGAHFAGLQGELAIIVCDRYSAYKKLARLADNILLAFCWAHVRRDFLDSGRTYDPLESWALDWKEHIGLLYHLNKKRLEHWDPKCPLTQQSDTFNRYHQELKDALQQMHDEAVRVVALDVSENNVTDPGDGNELQISTENVSISAKIKQKKVWKSLLDHWPGLILFVENPEVPMDNNIAENSIRSQVVGRKNYYGSGSLWSADMAASLFTAFQTLILWGINVRRWVSCYLEACANNGGEAPGNIDQFIPWLMNQQQRAELCRAYPTSRTFTAPSVEEASVEEVPIDDSS